MEHLTIQCTKKLLDKLETRIPEVVPAPGNDMNQFYCWHANLVEIGRSKGVLLTNNLTRFSILLRGPKARDYAKLADAPEELIARGFREVGVREDVIQTYLQNILRADFSVTSDRSLLGTMKQVMEDVKWHQDKLEDGQVFQAGAVRWLANDLVKLGKEYDTPQDRLISALAEMMGQTPDNTENVFSVEKYELEVRLRNTDAYRRFQIPSIRTFQELMEMLHKLFGWSGYADYWIGSLNAKGEMNRAEESSRLSDFFQDTSKCIYYYEYEGGAFHDIYLRNVISECQNNRAVLLEMEGQRTGEAAGDSLEEREEWAAAMSNPYKGNNLEILEKHALRSTMWYKGAKKMNQWIR